MWSTEQRADEFWAFRICKLTRVCKCSKPQIHILFMCFQCPSLSLELPLELPLSLELSLSNSLELSHTGLFAFAGFVVFANVVNTRYIYIYIYQILSILSHCWIQVNYLTLLASCLDEYSPSLICFVYKFLILVSLFTLSDHWFINLVILCITDHQEVWIPSRFPERMKI